MKVSVSILKEYDKLISAISKVNNSDADFLHVDVMDGKFVNNIKFPYEVTRFVKEKSTKPLDVHMMVNDYDMIKKYINLKPEYLTIHVEILKDNNIIDLIKKNGIKVGLAINPETKVESLIPFINEIDLVLFMSVDPGAGGQKFKESTLSKIRKLKTIAPNNLVISVDGGINDETAVLCKEAGCNMLVSGSYITNSENYNEKIDNLR